MSLKIDDKIREKWDRSPSLSFVMPLAILISLLLILSACDSPMAPEPKVIEGSTGEASYLFFDWDGGLRVLIWDDLTGGSRNMSMAHGDDFQQSGGARANFGGRGYEYDLKSVDGQTAEFTISGVPYDLSSGTLFIVHTIAGSPAVDQLDLDLTWLEATNSGIEDFGRLTPAIAEIIAPQG